MGFDNIAGYSEGDINAETDNSLMEQSGIMRWECFFFAVQRFSKFQFVCYKSGG